MAARRPYVTAELIEILRLKMAGFSNKRIGEALDRTDKAIGLLIGTLHKAIYAATDAEAEHIVVRNASVGSVSRMNILKVREMIKQGLVNLIDLPPKPTQPPTPPPTSSPQNKPILPPTEDRFERLDRAFAQFQEAITEFIREEVDSRVEEQAIKTTNNFISNLRQSFQRVQ